MEKKIRFGVIGTSTITDKVLKGAFCDLRFEFTALYSRSRETAVAFGEKYGVKHLFTSLTEMAESDLIDAVYIASPNSFHAPQSLVFLENKKHVLCEKPFAASADEVRQMINAAKRNGVTLMEAMKPTLTPNFRAVAENLDKIGKIRKYFSSYCQYSSRYDNYRAGIIENAFRPELANGSLVDIGVYTIYPMVVLFGRPLSIKASGYMLESGVDGEGSAVFKYPDMTATVLFSKITSSRLPTEIQGEDGAIILDKIGIIDDVKLERRGEETISLTREALEFDYYYEVKEFIDLIEDGRQESDVNSWERSLIVMEIMDEIKRQIIG